VFFSPKSITVSNTSSFFHDLGYEGADLMNPVIEYKIAYAAIHGYCVATEVVSVQDLVEVLWPQLPGSVYVPLDVFRDAARDVLHEYQGKGQVLENDECALLLARARSGSG
jgi:hypothetical protein